MIEHYEEFCKIHEINHNGEKYSKKKKETTNIIKLLK